MPQTIITLRVDETASIGGLPVRLHAIGMMNGHPVCAELMIGVADQVRTFRKKFKRPVDCTTADEQAVIDLAVEWCRKVTRITVLNQDRASAIFARLRDGYRFDACRAAVEEYGRDEWHRKHNAWLDIADFFTPQKLEIWIRKAEDKKLVEEKRRHANTQIPNAAVQQALDQLVEAKRIKSEDENLTAIFDKKHESEKNALYDQAFKELESVHPGIRPRLKKSWNHYLVQQQILTILRREINHGAHPRTKGSAQTGATDPSK